MPHIFGTDVTFMMVDEVTYDTTPGTPAGIKLYPVSCGVKASRNLLDPATITTARVRTRPGAGNINVAGALKYELSAQDIGHLLKHAIGAPTTSGAGPYTHTFKPAALPTSFLLEKDHGSKLGSSSGRTEYFNGCRISSVAFDFPTEGFCTADFSIQGAKTTLGTAPLDASLTDYGHTSFTSFEATLIKEGGSSIATVQSAQFTVDNGLDGSMYVIGGAGVRRSLPEGFCTISGTLTALFEDASLIAKAIARTPTSFQITLSRGDGLGSAGNESIDFTIPHMDYELSSPAVETASGLVVQLGFKAYASSPDLGLAVVVKNAVATYA